MKTVEFKINDYNYDLWCVASKERIHIGEKYVEVHEDYFGEDVVKEYKLEYAPLDEDEEPYICTDEE